MTGRERFLRTFAGLPTEGRAATPHWWGLYKFAHAGLISGYEDEGRAWNLSGHDLADVDGRFIRDVRPDMIHMTTGPCLSSSTDAERAERKRLFEAVGRLESNSVIDEYVEAHYRDKEEVLRSGVFAHIPALVERYGSESVLVLNEGNPISWVLDPNGCVGFENGLIALLERPDRMEYLLHRCYEGLLPRMAALKECGADGYIGSETYCSADLISPDLYRNLIFEAQRGFYDEVRRLGLLSISYFLGNIDPLLPDLAHLGIDGLMVEEGKKGFRLDIDRIYRSLDGAVTLFGNLDSVEVLQKGSRRDVVEETVRQLAACDRGRFIMSNGCPISFGTPLENIQAMLETAWSWSA